MGSFRMRLISVVLALALCTLAHAAPCGTGDSDSDSDSDKDGITNNKDTDDDVPTRLEDYNSRGGTPGDGDPTNDDFDWHTITDFLDDDLVPTACELKHETDHHDTDDDSVNDLAEWDWTASAAGRLPDFNKCTAPQDTDRDDVVDPLDEDDDGDVADTIIEGYDDIDGVPPYDTPCDTWGGETCDLSDPGDGIPNHLDLDSDADGTPDSSDSGHADDRRHGRLPGLRRLRLATGDRHRRTCARPRPQVWL
ncbi:MAG: hypothetical protein ACI9MC_002116 [Kiritimatiellia bacterium]|jgi:hypothetical protein